MSDIDTMLAEVLEVERVKAEYAAEPDPVPDLLEECVRCGCAMRLRDGCDDWDERGYCDDCAQCVASEYAPALAAEVERLREEVDRLTRDRDRLAGYVRAARQLSRDAHTNLLEERPEEAARTIFRAICALASAVEEGDGR